MFVALAKPLIAVSSYICFLSCLDIVDAQTHPLLRRKELSYWLLLSGLNLRKKFALFFLPNNLPNNVQSDNRCPISERV